MKVNIGDTITMGTYPQVDPYGGSIDPIEWKVLDVQDGKAQVISVKALDNIAYNKVYVEVKWTDCSLRHWLNETFYETAFTEEEKAQIVPVTVSNPGNPKYDVPGCEDTVEKVYALSTEEVLRLIPEKADRQCEPTPYCEKQGTYVYAETGKCCWWLRTPGFLVGECSRVNVGGGISDLAYDDIRPHRAARPVMWIKVD